MSTVTGSEIERFGRKGFTKLQARLLDLSRQGRQPRQLALALSLGMTIGLLPTVWGTSVLCFLLAWLFGLNQLLVQLANYLVYPLQILLFVPYFQLGERLVNRSHRPRNLDSLLSDLQAAPLSVLEQYWQANLQAVLAWLLSTPLLLLCSFLLALQLTRKLRLDSSR